VARAQGRRLAQVSQVIGDAQERGLLGARRVIAVEPPTS
jgi:hypothetical protein